MDTNTPDMILNICTGVGHSIEDVLNILIALTGHSPVVTTEQSLVRSNEVWSLVGDPARINELMGGSLYVELSEILTRMSKGITKGME
jgi:UDP-glucose 4-epimerase